MTNADFAIVYDVIGDGRKIMVNGTLVMGSIRSALDTWGGTDNDHNDENSLKAICITHTT